MVSVDVMISFFILGKSSMKYLEEMLSSDCIWGFCLLACFEFSPTDDFLLEESFLLGFLVDRSDFLVDDLFDAVSCWILAFKSLFEDVLLSFSILLPLSFTLSLVFSIGFVVSYKSKVLL